jgi:N-acetylglucosaminyldiphosphoundecaprenol N-acetyl-beta-D-mannosaminyltransferase
MKSTLEYSPALELAFETASPRPVTPRLEAETYSTIDLMGLSIHRLTLDQCVDHVLKSIRDGRGGWVVTPNLDILRRIYSDCPFRDLISGSTLRVADGVPLVWASRLQRTPLPGRVNGTDLMMAIAVAAAAEGRSVYLLGGASGTAEAAATALETRSPTLKVAGIHCPPLGFETDPTLVTEIAERLKTARPDVIFVGLGCPKQDHLITLLRPLLPEAWWFGIGVSFSFIGGTIPRAPRWMQKNGLEWIHRLAHEPSRLMSRYLVHGVPFGMRLFVSAVAKRFRKGTGKGGHVSKAATNHE